MLHQEIERALRAAVAAVLPDADPAAVLVRPCPDPKFGDYQSNSLIALAKTRGRNPRQLATEVQARLDLSASCEAVDIAGPGFLNFRLKPVALAAALDAASQGGPLFFRPAAVPRAVVVDFSSPNVAKPMHVGHIRSTFLGDCLQRVLRLLGHRVTTDNHIGDWGTQFGMLILGWKERLDRAALEQDPMGELERLYRDVSRQCDEDKPEFDAATRERARAELVKLQGGDLENLAIWREMQRLSQAQFDAVYGRLGITFDHTLGESFYNPWLPAVVSGLADRGVARESDGAMAVFSDGSLPPKEDPFLVSRDGQWVPDPGLVRKRDGGFNYLTTDLATIDYRLKTWQPAEILYVVDDRQAPHFRKLFLAFARWQPEAARGVRLRHIGFGKILGDDGKPYKTRSGDTVKLKELLDEAEERAFALVSEKNRDLPEAERRNIARVVGLGAVKYADLLPNRQSDYVFSWEKMLSLQGNTAPYLQYAYARIRSIFRKGGAATGPTAAAGIQLAAPEELALARHLLNFGLTLEAVAEEGRPNFLCNYLYDLAGLFARFYEACPVLKSEGAMRSSRLALCDLTGRVLQQGLAALGIETLEQM
ncbi:MAG: arginine--tRNA ligase [Verrucomicrobiota bacterium]